MHPTLSRDLADFDAILDRAGEMAGNYLNELPQRPAAANLPVSASTCPRSASAATT